MNDIERAEMALSAFLLALAVAAGVSAIYNNWGCCIFFSLCTITFGLRAASTEIVKAIKGR